MRFAILRPIQSMKRPLLVLAAMLVFASHAPFGFAQETAPADAVQVAAPEVDIPEDELDRGTPRRSLRGFLTATQNRDFETAAEYLDLRDLPSRMNITDSPRLAHGLSIVIDRHIWIDCDR